jgi:hypothetical protein
LKKFIVSKRFKLTPKRYYCTFYRSDIDPPDNGLSGKKESKKHKRKQKILMLQIPVNLNDATTVHKLQGVTKKHLIVHNWSYTQGWIYTVLSRVRTRDGFFLNKPLAYKPDSFKLPQSLLRFQQRISQKIPKRASC